MQFAEDTAEGAELPLNKFTPHCSWAKGAEIGPVAFWVWNLHGKVEKLQAVRERGRMWSLNVKDQKSTQR